MEDIFASKRWLFMVTVRVRCVNVPDAEFEVFVAIRVSVSRSELV